MADNTPTGVGSVPAPMGGGGYPKFVDLGNGYTIVYSDPYDSGSIVATKSVGGAESGGLSQNTVYSQQQQNARDQASLAEQQRQFDLTQGERKARGDQQMNLDTTLGQGNLAVSQGNLGVNQGRLALDTQGQALDYYKYLANQAANPRNFVENFFLRRGQGAPAGAAAYGNNDAALRQFSGFRGQAAAPAQTQAQYPTGPQSTPPTAQGGGYASPYEGLSGFGQNGMLRLAPNDPDAAALMAKYPGRYEMTSPDQAAKYLPRFAQGGTVTMNEPHALINLRTGQPVAIAGEAGMEHAHFDGAVIKGEDLSTIDPYSGYLPGYDPTYYSPEQRSAPSTNTNQVMPGAEPTPFNISSIQAPPGYHWAGNQLVQDAPTAPAITSPTATTASAPTRTAPTAPTYVAPPPPPPVPPTTPTGVVGKPPMIDSGMLPGAGTVAPPPITVNQPTSLPQNGQTAQPTVPGGLTPRDVAAPGTFGGIAGSGGVSGARPQFLSGEGQSTLDQLTSAGIVPPFLQRSFAQSRGVSSQGTNQPNPFNLPKDVPLLSKIAWLQLSPDEQQAYLSYASSYGVTPEEYIAAIDQYAPQGGQTPWSQFGTPFAFARQ